PPRSRLRLPHVRLPVEYAQVVGDGELEDRLPVVGELELVVTDVAGQDELCHVSGSLEGWGGGVVAAGAADAEPGPQVYAARALTTLLDGDGTAGQLQDDVFAGVAEVEQADDVVDPLLALAECGADGCCVGPGDGIPVVAGGLV